MLFVLDDMGEGAGACVCGSCGKVYVWGAETTTMIYPYELGDTIWHGARYWKQDDLQDGEVQGWNTEWIPYQVMQITAKRILIGDAATGETFYLNRRTMEHDGCQYHTRVHEYFFAQKPNVVGDYIGKIVENGIVRV